MKHGIFASPSDNLTMMRVAWENSFHYDLRGSRIKRNEADAGKKFRARCLRKLFEKYLKPYTPELQNKPHTRRRKVISLLFAREAY